MKISPTCLIDIIKSKNNNSSSSTNNINFSRIFKRNVASKFTYYNVDLLADENKIKNEKKN